MQIIKGIDGSYVIKAGKLLKIVKAEYSKDYLITTSGYVKYTLEDGSEFIVN